MSIISPVTPPPNPSGPVPPSGQPSQGGGWKIPVLFGFVIVLLAGTGYLYYRLSALQNQLGETREALLAEIARVEETSSVTARSHRKTVEQLKEEVEQARKQASLLAGQAKVDATKHAEDLAAKLEAEQKKQAQLVNSQITEVKQANASTTARVGEVSSEVGNVKTDLAGTKSELEKTIATLKSAQGDLGVQSGLIATNGRELAALKALGERNIFEFKLAKSKHPQKVGDIAVQLKRADQKHNRYTIEVVADDKKVEKKDKNINEPVQFYVSRARQPYEIVVNEVRKNMIIGYLATPKVQAVRN